MIKDVQRIGYLNYATTILTGKNRALLKVVKYNRTKDKEEYDFDLIYGDFVITIGRKAIILTNQIEGERREPYIVKKWANVTEKKESDELLFKIKTFLYWLKSFLGLLPYLSKSYFKNKKEFSRLMRGFKDYWHNDFDSREKTYIDNDGFKWIYVKDDNLNIEWLSLYSKEGEIEYKFVLKQGHY